MQGGKQEACRSRRGLDRDVTAGPGVLIGRKFLEGELCGVCFESESCLKPSLKVRVCPAWTQWGGWFINHFYSPCANYRTHKS